MLAEMKKRIDDIFKIVESGEYARSLQYFEPPDYFYANERLDKIQRESMIVFQVPEVWRQLSNLSVMYEEIVREWFLPTLLGHMLSAF